MNTYDDSRPHLKLVGGTDFEKKKLGIPPQHRGILFSRVIPGMHPQENTRRLEEGFVEEWSEWNKENPFLEQLLCADTKDPRYKFVPKTLREWEIAHLVAATVIQWLPTAVGSSFLGRSFRRGGGDFTYRLPECKEHSR